MKTETRREHKERTGHVRFRIVTEQTEYRAKCEACGAVTILSRRNMIKGTA